MKSGVASGIAVAALGAVVIVAVGVFVFGWGSSLPQSPEALFAKIADYQAAGETGKIWDLLSDEGREEQVRGFEAHRKLIRQDPNEKLTRQYNCSREEFMRMSDVQIYCKENEGREHALDGAKIVERRSDPREPDEVYLSIETPANLGVTMHAKHVAGGWRLVDMRARNLK